MSPLHTFQCFSQRNQLASVWIESVWISPRAFLPLTCCAIWNTTEFPLQNPQSIVLFALVCHFEPQPQQTCLLPVCDSKFCSSRRTSMLTPFYLAPTPENTPTLEFDDSDSDHDSPDDEYDLAVSHARNEKLKKHKGVKEFFSKVRTTKSLWDDGIHEWLRTLPRDMLREAIPLFENVSENEDYQLHPTYSWLTSDTRVEDPDLYSFYISSSDTSQLQKSRIFMPLGRLFVNAGNPNRFNEQRCRSKRSRLARWTGYEVFVGHDSRDLALWIMLDRQVHGHQALPCYPVSCSLMDFVKHNTTNPLGGPCTFARLLPLFAGLEHATFEEARESLIKTCTDQGICIGQVEKGELGLCRQLGSIF